MVSEAEHLAGVMYAGWRAWRAQLDPYQPPAPWSSVGGYERQSWLVVAGAVLEAGYLPPGVSDSVVVEANPH